MERVIPEEPHRRLARTNRPVFTGPGRNIAPMLLFVSAVSVLVFALAPTLEQAFYANAYINGAIGVVLLIGVAYTFHQALGVRPAVSWLTDFSQSPNPAAMRKPPALIAPLALLMSEPPGRLRIPAPAARSMLDSIGARMSEAGELTRYLARLLIFLGLLGTFWGLLETVGALVEAVGGLSADAGASGDAAIAGLFVVISDPLKGMGTAFSSSIFGLAGSLVLGFLDLQTTQAQNRFYTEVEDWFVSITKVGAAAPAGFEDSAPTSGSFVNALLEQTAESLESLQSLLARSEEGRARQAESLAYLSTSLSALNDRLARQEDALQAIKERALDDTLIRHARNLDVTLQRLAGDMVTEREQSNKELRSELRALSKTIAAALEMGARRERK